MAQVVDVGWVRDVGDVPEPAVILDHRAGDPSMRPPGDAVQPTPFSRRGSAD